MHSKPLVITALFAAFGVAQDDVQYETRTATITQCFTRDGLRHPTTVTVPGPTCVVHKPAVTGEAIVVEVQAPDCHCGCPTCVHTLEYTTKYAAFCSTGMFEQEYVITETYSGMEAKPTKNKHDLPHGFTCEVQTCTTCGPEPVTTTITHPVAGHYMNEVAPTEIPMAKPGKEQPGTEQPGTEQPGIEHPKKQPEEQGNSAPKVTEDDNGFRSTVKATPVPYSPVTTSPGESTDYPVIVSGATRHLALASASIILFAFIQFVFL